MTQSEFNVAEVLMKQSTVKILCNGIEFQPKTLKELAEARDYIALQRLLYGEVKYEMLSDGIRPQEKNRTHVRRSLW